MQIILELDEMFSDPEALRGVGEGLVAHEAKGYQAIGQALVALTCENCEGAKTLGRLNLPCPACHGTGWAGGKPPFPRTRRVGAKAQAKEEPVLPLTEPPPDDDTPTGGLHSPEGAGQIFEDGAPGLDCVNPDSAGEVCVKCNQCGKFGEQPVVDTSDTFDEIPNHPAATAEPKRPRGRPGRSS